MTKLKPLVDINILPKFLLILTMTAGMAACGDETREAPAEIEETQVEEEEGAEIGAVEWDYENTNWEAIKDTDCNTAVQSPVDIRPEEAIPAKLPEITYKYKPFQMIIVDNGHTIQGFGSENSFITVGNKRYQFLQFHFHSPSEHTINGEAYPLELHLVHQEVGTDNLAVVGVFIEEGEENSYIGNIFNEIPSEEKVEKQTNLMVNLSDFIPPAQDYYTYIGSLTTPPCTVGVDWILFDEPIQASTDQIGIFTKVHDNTARPVKPLQNRRVYTTMQ